MKALVYDISPVRWVVCKAAGAVTKRAYFGSLSPLRLVERPVPTLPGPDWVRLKTRLGGICGTDFALILQRNHPATILQQFSRFPAVLGHENVAIIDAVGSDAADWPIGRRVCVDPALGCAARGNEPVCDQCRLGRTSLCEHPGDDRFPPRVLLGLNPLTGGSWAEFFLAHVSQLHAVPDRMTDEAAVLVDPVASAAHAVLRRPPRSGEAVLVNGSGVIALGVIAAIRALGLDNRITAVVRHPFQAESAMALGATRALVHPRRWTMRERFASIAADVNGVRLAGRFGNQALIGGYAVTYECTGSPQGLSSALKWTRARGTVVAAGTTGIARIDTTPFWFDELEVVGANGRQVELVDGRRLHSYDLVFEWITSGRLDLSKMVVARYPLSEYRRALADLLDRSRNRFIKAVFAPDGP